MSNAIKVWCFLLLLPFFAVIGHDFYVNFIANEANKARLEVFDIDPKQYQNSDLGYIVTKYAPELYENARLLTGEEIWIKWVDPVLRLYSFIVALIPALMFFVWLLIARIFDIWPFSGGLKAAADIDRDIYGRRGAGGESSNGPLKYRRR